MGKTVHVKCSNGQKCAVVIESSTMTVGELKAQMVEKANIPVAQQRLIYKGRVLKDDNTLESYGVEEDHTIHLVKGAAPAGSTGGGPPASVPAPGVANAGNASSLGASNAGGLGLGRIGFGGLAGLGGAGGAEGMGGADFNRLQQQLMQDPAAVREMMNSPIMQSLLNNPDLMRSMFASNPQMQEIMDRNPDIAHILNDPAIMRQTVEAARNPEMMREMMRNMDRAMSNIEATPEGFNMLRRMYENVQEPMMSAAQRQGTDGGANMAENPLSALFGAGAQHQDGAQRGGAPPATAESAEAPAAPNTAPLPNPWNPTGGAGAGNPAAGAASGRQGAPPALGLAAALGNASRGMGGPGLGGVGPLGGVGGLGDAGGLAMDPAHMQSMLQNPVMQQMMQQVLANPDLIQQLIGANPALQSMVDSNPQFREAMQNPDFLRQMADPNTFQQMMQLQNLVGQLQGTLGGLGGQGAGQGAAGGGAMPDMSALLQLMGNPAMGAFGGMPPAPVGNPEEAYATQLVQLQDMGFFDREENIRALSATGGNVNAAVERLLNSG